MKTILSRTLCAAAMLLAVTALAPRPAKANIFLLDFEGLKDLESVGNYYNGGTGGSGSGPGTNYGVTFSSNALALIDSDAGGSGNFGGEPSPSTVLFFLTGSAATMDVASGFDTGFSFYYSSPFETGQIKVYDGLDGTGNVLATLDLPTTPLDGAPDPTGDYSPFVPVGVSFQGLAKSVDFAGTINQIGFDNITFGQSSPVGPVGAVPEPATCALLGTGLLAGALRRLGRRGSRT